ncbi:hypothetical protein OG21DRAFT_924834 [Imleria badia]|nr:hypothetical protein OG21DRAFT_924834 [Imleria badia]
MRLHFLSHCCCHNLTGQDEQTASSIPMHSTALHSSRNVDSRCAVVLVVRFILTLRFCSPAPGAPLQVDLMHPSDLTDTLQQLTKRIVGRGAFGTVYSCQCTQNGVVAIKAISLSQVKETEKDEFIRASDNVPPYALLTFNPRRRGASLEYGED